MPVIVSLTVIDGPDKDATFEFAEGEVRIGRRRGDLVLNDKKISTEHCRFLIEDDHVYVEDLKSTNGTFVAGNKIIGRSQIQNLDEVIIGLSRISVAIIEQIHEPMERTVSASQQPTKKDVIPNAAVKDESSAISFIEDSSIGAGIDDDILSGVEFKPKAKKKVPGTTAATATAATLASALEPTPAEPATKSTKAAAPSRADKMIDEVSQTLSLPDPDAVYRETGVHRIDDLIKDEMATFSKWDHPATPESPESGSPVVIPKIKVSIKIRKGPEGQAEYECKQAISTLGRKDVDIRINDLDCSRKHAQIEIVGGKQVFVKDLASTNGTFVNGKKITTQEVNSGDMVQIGQTLFEIQIENY